MSAGASPAIGLADPADTADWRGADWHGSVSVEGWTARPLSCEERPVLAQGELHLWSADLDSGGPPTTVLSSEELERAERVIRPQARGRWLAARVFLRTLLASYLREDPRSLLFSVQARGKPLLAERSRHGLHFNLSHSGPLAICALTRMCAVGVDVQLMPRDLNARRLGARLLGAQQAARLDRLGPTDARAHVLRAWTGLEAERKRTGVGLGAGGERFSGPRPWLARMELEGAGAGAVALALPPSALFRGSWSYFRLSGEFCAK